MTSDAPIDPASLLACAIDAARAAGAHALAHRDRRERTIQVSHHDVKLELDVECQKIAEAIISDRYPTHALLGEEGTKRTARPDAAADIEWIIDPIDGTVNFSHGFPLWCCAIAARRSDDVLAGVVFAPELNELYTATSDGAALLNGAEIRVTARKRLDQSIIMTGMDKNISPLIPPYTFFNAIATSARKARIMGSAAIDICRVARGQADGYFEAGIYIWDYAAAALITRRAGGRTEILREYDGGRIMCVCSNGHIHGELRDTLLACLPE